MFIKILNISIFKISARSTSEGKVSQISTHFIIQTEIRKPARTDFENDFVSDQNKVWAIMFKAQ
jgi:hypothetical protein